MITTTTSIKMWAEDDRPREKLMLKGKSALSDAELIAILLGSGTRTKTAVDLAKEILSSTDLDLNKLGRLTLSELKQFSGVGDAKALTLIAAMEIGRRRKAFQSEKPKHIQKSDDVYHLLSSHFKDLQHEEFRILGLTRSNKVIQSELISKGGRHGTIADGQMIFKSLIDMKASACILAHNHPSGTLRPSDQDLSLTKSLVSFGKMIDIKILDHIIFTDEGFYSFLDHSVMPM